MSKKTTLRDVAREAGVSVATVSYIMNNRSDQKISDATRKKVMQIANLLDYTPNTAAKSLATGRNHLIGIVYHCPPTSICRYREINCFTDLLSRRFHRLGYDVLLSSVTEENAASPFHHNVDAIIAVDLPKDLFFRLSDNCFVPVIGVDMLINDRLFFQIYSDIPERIRQAENILGHDYLLVWDPCSNEAYQNFITEAVSPERLLTLSQCTPQRLLSLSQQSSKLLALGAGVGLMLQPYISPERMAVISSETKELPMLSDYPVVPNDVIKKANVTVNIILNAMDKKFDVSHDLKITTM